MFISVGNLTLDQLLRNMWKVLLECTYIPIKTSNILINHSCYRNVLRNFRFKLFSMGKSYKFGVTTINRKIPKLPRVIKCMLVRDAFSFQYENHFTDSVTS